MTRNHANRYTECKESKTCAPAKHHFDECVERVTGADEGKAHDKKHPNEDCVEECKHFCVSRLHEGIYLLGQCSNFCAVFHLAHCAGQCAAPKVWASLK